MIEARRLAMEKMRPGVSCSEVDTVAKEFLKKEGYRDKLLHRTGHGIGIAYHAEAPWLAEGCYDVLAPGMVISVEPGIYLPTVGGYRHSDTVLVTKSGNECLTGYPTDIESLTLTTRKPLAQLRRVYLTLIWTPPDHPPPGSVQKLNDGGSGLLRQSKVIGIFARIYVQLGYKRV